MGAQTSSKRSQKIISKWDNKSLYALYISPPNCPTANACCIFDLRFGDYSGEASGSLRHRGSSDWLLAWWENNSDGQTHPVGQKLPNAWGLYDTLGNVWEWCLGVYTPKGFAIPALDMTEPSHFGADLGGGQSGSSGQIDPALSPARAVRGGSWDNGEYDCRSARRTKVPEALHYDNLGFRPILAQKRGVPISSAKPRLSQF